MVILIVQGYVKENEWNMDETGFGVFYQIAGLARRVVAVSEGEKKRFFVTASGEKEKPVVIWKSDNPKCLHKASLPVSYYNNFDEWQYARSNIDQTESPPVQLK